MIMPIPIPPMGNNKYYTSVYSNCIHLPMVWRDTMKKAIVLLFAIAAIAALIVPLHDSFSAEADSVVETQKDPAVLDGTSQGMEASDYSYWGYIALFGAVAFIGSLIYLEHRGILKDPMLY